MAKGKNQDKKISESGLKEPLLEKVIHQELVNQSRFSQVARNLFLIVLLTRVLFVFLVAPVSYMFWNRKASFDESGSILEKALLTLNVFDSTHFKEVTEQKGYEYETNHAFMPLVPYVIHHLARFSGIQNVILAGFVFQFVIQYLNSILLYLLSKNVLLKEDLAYKASLIYAFNHSLVYSMALQTEIIFTFLTFFGLLIMYSKVDPSNVIRTVRSNKIIPAAFIFGLNVLCRVQAVLMLGFTGMIMLKKILANSDRFFKTFKYLFYTIWIIIIFALSYSAAIYWKPFVMHCESKLDRTDAVPKWCFEAMPNVFNHIQKIYWDNRLFGFLHRSPDHILVASPMIIFFIYILQKFLRHQPGTTLTFGILSLKSESAMIHERIKENSIYQNPALIPFAWNFIVNMLLVILFANIDIISRVASTNVIYYWAFAQLISDYTSKSGNVSTGTKIMTWIVVIHNIAYMVLNLQLFLTETAFF